MGRKKIPSNIHKLKGTDRADRMNPDEPAYEKAGIIPTPLIKENDYALEEWIRVAPGLISLSVLARVDIGALERYCISHSVWREAVEGLNESGLLTKSVNGHIQPSPFASLIKQHGNDANKYASELGITPASRAKVSAKKPESKKDEWGAFGS